MWEEQHAPFTGLSNCFCCPKEKPFLFLHPQFCSQTSDWPIHPVKLQGFISDQFLSLSLRSILFLVWLVLGSFRGLQDSQQLLFLGMACSRIFIQGWVFALRQDEFQFLWKSKDLITQKSSNSLIPVLPVFPPRTWLQRGRGKKGPGVFQTQTNTVPCGLTWNYIFSSALTAWSDRIMTVQGSFSNISDVPLIYLPSNLSNAWG